MFERINAGATHPAVHQADALCAGHFVFVSGLMADDGVEGLAADARPSPGYPYFESDVKRQARVLLGKLGKILAQAGLNFSHVVKAHAFLMEPKDFFSLNEAWGEFFDTRISRTFVKASDLPVAGARFCIDFIACRPNMGIEIVRADAGAAPPFSRKVEATRVGDLVFTSGQLGYDPRFGFPLEASQESHNPSGGSNVVRQSRFTLANLGKSLAAVGGAPQDVVNAKVYLTDMANRLTFIHDWRQCFQVPPSETIVEEGLFVPGGLLEIDVTGFIRTPGIVARPVGDTNPPAGFLLGRTLFTSAHTAVDATGCVPPALMVHPSFPNYGSTIKLQTRHVLEQLANAFEKAGGNLGHTCKATVYLTDLNDFSAMEEVWTEFFTEPPARSVLATPSVGHKDARIAVDLIGWINP